MAIRDTVRRFVTGAARCNHCGRDAVFHSENRPLCDSCKYDFTRYAGFQRTDRPLGPNV